MGTGSPEGPATRYGASFEELARLLADWGEPGYRAQQVWEGLYRRRAPLEDLTNVGDRKSVV